MHEEAHTVGLGAQDYWIYWLYYMTYTVVLYKCNLFKLYNKAF